MKLLSICLVSLALMGAWETDFEDAKKEAQKEHKLILLNFSGSDWCIPCIQFKKEILESTEFVDYAGGNLVLVNADFPRLSKHQLSKDQQKKNDKLAEKYNQDGIFPLTLLLDSDGKVLEKWEGFPRSGAPAFISQIKAIINARP